MLARDATAAEEREQYLMSFEDALETCLEKYREAEDRLHDYRLYYRLAISFRTLSEDNFRQTVREKSSKNMNNCNNSVVCCTHDSNKILTYI